MESEPSSRSSFCQSGLSTGCNASAFLPETISKVLLPRLQPSEQGGHASPNKSAKVSQEKHPSREMFSSKC